MNSQFERNKFVQHVKVLISLFMFVTIGIFSLNAQNFAIVGNGTTGNSSNTFPAPFGNANFGAKHQFLVTAQELTAASVVSGAMINSIGLNVLTDNGSTIHNSFQIRVYSTTLTNPLGSGYVTTNQISSSTSTNFNPAVGWNQISVSSFTWDGVSNLVIQTCFNNNFSSTNASTQWTLNLVGSSIKSRYNHSNSSFICSVTSPTSTSTTIRPNIRFGWSCSSPGTVNSAQTICSGNQPVPLTVVGSSGAIQWQFSPTGSIWTDISGATSTTLSSAQMGTLSSSRFYRVINTGSCTTSSSSNNVLITVNEVNAGSIGSHQTICSGETPNTITSISLANGSGSVNYQWQSSLNGSTWTNISGASTSSYTPTALLNTTQFRRVANSLLNGNGCTAFSNVIQITVNSVSSGGISGNQTICEGQIPSFISSQSGASGSGIISYSWESSINGTSWLGVSGITTEGYQPPTLSNTTHFRRVATSSLTNTSCSANTNAVTITVNNVNPGTIGTNQIICEGESPELLVPVSESVGTGSLSYQWATTQNNITWYSIALATGSTFQPPILNTTTYYRRNTTSLLNGLGCSQTSNAVEISVVPSSTTINISSIGPYLFNNQFYFESGSYVDTLFNNSGCETIINLNLTIHGLNTPENEQQQIIIFPNPSTNGIFYLNKPSDLKCENLKIYNSAGVMINEILDFESVVDISNLSAGCYFLHLNCAEYRYVLKLQKL